MDVGARTVERNELRRSLARLATDGWAAIELPPSWRHEYREIEWEARRFFARDESEKAVLDIRSSDGHRGWVPTTEAGAYADEGERRYESFDIGRAPRPSDVVHHPLRGVNQFPPDAEGRELQRKMTLMFDQLAGLAERIGDEICADLGVSPAEFRRLRREPVSQLRLIHYLARPEEIDLRTDAAAMGAHTDYEFFTLFHQSEIGTEALGRDGNWFSLPADGRLVILAGDMLEVFSNGRFRSILHRAAGSVRAGRLSIPFFVGADFDALVGPANGSGHAEIVFGEHLMRQLERDFPYLRERTSSLIDVRSAEATAARSSFERDALHRMNTTGWLAEP